jgi:ABC-type multidrug transport system fused ATPase/permease subunit
MQESHIRLLDTSQRPYYLLYCLQRWLSLVLDLMVAALAITVVTLAVTVRSKTGGAAIGIALNNTLGFNASLRILVDSWTQLETSLGAISRIKSFEATVIPEDKEDEHQKPPQDWPGKGAVEFRNVTASYG